MKLKLIFSTLLGLLFAGAYAQDRTTVSATSSEISDNLDLRAVASIFGDSRDLEDFENRLNDPNNQISNLDLNGDNKVDYLRVIETVEGRTHIIVVQSVLGRDVFQDVATIEVERDGNNRVQVQVVGDVYMYGTNYIYEPVYVHTPVIYAHFWRPNYRPYCSVWYWGYYPSYYVAWHPFPIFRYRSHIALHINFGHHYNYVNYRRCQVAYNHYYHRRANAYERQYPNRSFASRNANYANRHELDKTRNIRTVGSNGSRNNQLASNNTRGNTRSENNRDTKMSGASSRVNNSRDAVSTRGNTSRDVRTKDAGPRVTNPGSGRNYGGRRENTVGIAGAGSPRVNNDRGNGRTYDAAPRGNSSRSNQMEAQRANRSAESRGFSGDRGQRSMPSVAQSNGGPRGGESRGNQGGGQSRGGGESRGSGRR